MRNLASTARRDLILSQNAAMAAAVGRWEDGRDPDIMERFPCWRYVRSSSASPRDSHARYADKVFRKDDPIWHKIFPPSDFGCKCSSDLGVKLFRPKNTKVLAYNDGKKLVPLYALCKQTRSQRADPWKPEPQWILRQGLKEIERALKK